MDQTVHHSHTPHLDPIAGPDKAIAGFGDMNESEPSTEQGFGQEVLALKESMIAPDSRLVAKLIHIIAARHEEAI